MYDVFVDGFYAVNGTAMPAFKKRIAQVDKEAVAKSICRQEKVVQIEKHSGINYTGSIELSFAKRLPLRGMNDTKEVVENITKVYYERSEK